MKYIYMGVFVFLSVIMICATYMQVTGAAFENMWIFVSLIISQGIAVIFVCSFADEKK